MERNEWFTIKNQSLAAYTRQAGFDLSIYDQYSASVKSELRKKSIRQAVIGIEGAFSEKNISISDIKTGIYVISLSSPLTISYKKKVSQVIYIGMGNILGRIKSHFEESLFDFMQSLSGANFDFSFACPFLKNNDKYYKHIEWSMLEYFSEKYGGMDDRRRFPLLNTNAGAKQDIDDDDKWWSSPLKNSGKTPRCTLLPTEHSEFASLD